MNFKEVTKDNPSPRIQYIDLLKCVSIYFICLYHFGNIFPKSDEDFIKTLLMIISSCAVPIFFMCSGAVLLNKSINYKIYIKKIIKIVILTIAWALLTVLFLTMIRHETISLIEIIKIVAEWRVNWVNHLWFLHAMLVIYLVYPMLKAIFDTNIKYTYLFLGFLIVTIFGNNFLNICYNIFRYIHTGKTSEIISVNFLSFLNIFADDYFYVLVYFILGGILYRNKSKIKDSISKFKVMILLVMILLIYYLINTMLLKVTNCNYDMVWNGYKNVFTLLLSTCISILAQISEIKNCKLITFIGTNTFGIFVLHWIIGFVLQDYMLSINLILRMICIIMIACFCSLISNVAKHIPFIKYLFKF